MSDPTAVTTATATATPPRDLLLEARDITVRFGGVVAIDAVGLDVVRGETHGVIGPNGAGKTTLFDVISGIRQPTEGTVHLDGADVTARSAVWRARHGLRRTFQRQQVFGGLSVRDNLLVAQEWDSRSGGVIFDMLGITLGRQRQAAREARVEEVLALCGLEAVRDAYAASLPIGMARLVELGRAVVDPPSVLLLDEPSSGLGETEQLRLSETIHRIKQEHGCGVLLVEHDVAFVMSHCDRISVLDLGRKIAEGTPAEVSENADVRAAYLG